MRLAFDASERKELPALGRGLPGRVGEGLSVRNLCARAFCCRAGVLSGDASAFRMLEDVRMEASSL